MTHQAPPRRPPPSYYETGDRQKTRELLERLDEALAGKRPLLPEPKPVLLFVVQAGPGRTSEHCTAIREFLQSQLSSARHVVVLPPGVALVSTDAQPAPDMLKLPVIDQADSLPSTCSCGRGPVSFHPIGRKDATRMCVASPAACRPQQN